jgi:16S rRNA (guanine(966)-N(2))-methyltransferase RsmD
MDRMRESVFGALGELTGRSFLDLFSGSGIIALEAASRGAAFVEAVESDSLKRKTLLKNVSISTLRINCRFMSVELYVKRAKRNFDLVFLDPPFPYQYKWELIETIAKSNIVSSESKILIHRPLEDYQKKPIALLEQSASRRYGRSVVDFFTVVK